jgi:AcrR family transcriptional regulator/DNA-binding MarR family transcriptional regulator
VTRRVRTRTASSTTAPAGGRRRTAEGQRLEGRIPSHGGLPRVQVAEIQRSRLLAGALGAIEEHGYAQMTVAQITRRSRVSRRTFYEMFENREACLLALLDDALASIEAELAAADLGGLTWRERIRGGLWVILCFCDREPALARVLVDQSLHGGQQRVIERREEISTRLAATLDEGRLESSRAGECSPLTAEGLVGAAVGIAAARLLRGSEREPLAGLLGELMSVIVLPYLGSATARRERMRSALGTPPASGKHSGNGRLALERDPLEGVRMRMTYRTAQVLATIASRPGISNRMVAAEAGIHDQGQISKLLARLERLGLTENTGDGHVKGESNAWRLTKLGWQVAQRLRLNAHRDAA